MRIALALLLWSSAALAAGEQRSPQPGRVGLYPLTLPDGQEQLAARLAAQLHEGAAALPGVKAFDLVAHSACAPDEPPCLAAAARRAGLDSMISAAISATGDGYRFHLRAVAADGTLLRDARGQVRGGPLDLAGALERGVCEALGAAPCEGSLHVSSAEPLPVSVDGEVKGTPPVLLKLPVGRHVVKVGDAERRVRVSYARTVPLFAVRRAGVLALLDQPDAPVAVPEAALAAAPATPPRTMASRVLFGTGIGLLVAAVGVGLYAHSNPGSSAATYGTVALAATGAGAVAGAGLLLALTPSGAAVGGSF